MTIGRRPRQLNLCIEGEIKNISSSFQRRVKRRVFDFDSRYCELNYEPSLNTHSYQVYEGFGDYLKGYARDTWILILKENHLMILRKLWNTLKIFYHRNITKTSRPNVKHEPLDHEKKKLKVRQ